MLREHSSLVLAGQRAAAAFIGSSLTCRAGVVVVEEQPALIANTVMQTRIVARRTRRFLLIDIVLPKIVSVHNVCGVNYTTHCS